MSQSNKEPVLDNFFEPIETIIGERATFRGDFDLEAPIRIDGYFQGRIKSNSKVVVGSSGLVETNIEALFIVVSGKVFGNLYGIQKVHLISGAKVIGDIFAGNLVMEEGVEFKGRVKITPPIKIEPSKRK